MASASMEPVPVPVHGFRLIDCTRAVHADAILDIFNDAILNTTSLYDYKPRTAASMQQWFDAKEQGRLPVIGCVDENERLAGFASYGPFRPHAAYKYSVEHSLYLERGFRGRGLGPLMLAALIGRARQQDRHLMVGVIDMDNAVSIAMHRKFGFAHCGTIPGAGFKFGRWLDVGFFCRTLDTPGSPVDG